MSEQVPEGFGPILRSSPVLDALGGFHSKGAGSALEIGLLVGERHCNSRGTVHGGVLATLADIGMGYLMVFGHEPLGRSQGEYRNAQPAGLPDAPPRRMTTASLNIDYTGSAKVGDWIVVRMDAPKIARQIAFANARLMVGERQVARASAVFAVTQD
jgi:acyl-coenzyme A thioesterase PaaI-like protein